jgi:DNA modification methylase
MKTQELPPIQPGDVFLLGSHRLIYGDAGDQSIIAKLIGSAKVDLILVDPPFGVAVVEGKKGFANHTANHKVILNDHLQSDAEYRAFTKTWLETIKPHLATKNSIYVFNSDKMLFALREGMVDAGCHFGQLLIWLKTQAVVGRLDYLPQHELIAYGWIGTHQFHKSKDKSLLIYPRPSKSKLHPTMKPVGLLRRLILNSSRVGGCVYDCFGGSGSTLMACEDTKRRCFMAELDPEYCKTIINRFENATGISARKEEK